jgi:dTDP-4-dehydrorhamnose 3,5-epimerase
MSRSVSSSPARSDNYLLKAVRDPVSITADWSPLQDPIDGVLVREVKNVVKRNGDVLCEIFRSEWFENDVVNQVFQSVLNPGSISAWHAHRQTTDRLFVSSGLIRIVLFDARDGSPTTGRVNEYRFGAVRPALLIIPAGVWHGVENISSTPAVLLNIVDAAYQYNDPDHWRLPADSDKIPYRFSR